MAAQITSITPGFAIETTIDVANVATITTATQDVTVTGVKTGQLYLVAIEGLDTGLMLGGTAYGQAADTLRLTFVNPTAGGINPASGKVLRIVGV